MLISLILFVLSIFILTKHKNIELVACTVLAGYLIHIVFLIYYFNNIILVNSHQLIVNSLLYILSFMFFTFFFNSYNYFIKEKFGKIITKFLFIPVWFVYFIHLSFFIISE